MVDDGHEQEQMLPIANVDQIMRQVLPPRAKISKQAKQTIQECATEFISFVTGEASDKCHKENRRTVNGDDICWALAALGLDDYAEAIVRYLHKYREAERKKANNQNKATTTPESKENNGQVPTLENKEAQKEDAESRQPS
ncbi:hypothetical protein SLEP1_g10833 [Rubroshorea leprosula]|uniref:Transcription factor CBF/NF-Y/archaeal histone domain-containing protein n=1 Tax=Rubroshorea leprosula TaxID=152421 RepID=A0AAV5I9B2_9ROSI|nr:hypothetical protein SLEP1_g10833 [Rubroshorea leprosula]